MIVVAGFNTAIDRRVDIDALRPGSMQRASAARVRPGGKGLHVAQTAAALGARVALVGLDDATHAEALREYLHAHGVDWHPVRSVLALRECLAIHETGGRVTEILEAGPALAAADRDALLAALEAQVARASMLILSGSLPPGFPADTYAHIIRAAHARGVRCLLDASGAALREGIAAAPWLVKPNADEAGTLWGRPVEDIDMAGAFARWLHVRGVARVVVTLGARGAVGFDGEHLWHAQSGPVDVRDSVGSGDCFLAGLAVGTTRGDAFEASLRLATACGAANAEGGQTGLADPSRVAAWLPRVVVKPLAQAARAQGSA